MKKHSVILLNALPDKKIKSLGNKCLISLNKQKNILDYHIHTIKKIFKSPEIIIVCGFDCKKLKKYIQQKYKNLIYLEHNINDQTNVGTSIQLSIPHISGDSCLFLNTTNILYPDAVEKIKLNKDISFILTNKEKGSVGFIKNNDRVINCYYDLPNSIYDILYICSDQLSIFKKIHNNDLSKLFLFEIINLCISYGINLKSININSKSIILIDSINNIQKVQKKICSI